MTETCAYIAGLIDADGWIGICIANGKSSHASHTFTIGIVNRDLTVLQWVQSNFGGVVKPRNRNRKAPHAQNWTPIYDWIPYAGDVERFLLSVVPYLRIKRRQAELVLEFLKTIQRDRNFEYRLPTETRRKREGLYMQTKELNRPKPISREEVN